MVLAVADVRKRWCWLSGIALWYYSIMVWQYYSLVLSFHLFHKFCRIGTTLECSLSMVVEVQHVFANVGHWLPQALCDGCKPDIVFSEPFHGFGKFGHDLVEVFIEGLLHSF